VTVDRTAEPATNAAQRLEDQEFEDPDNQELYLQCLTPIWHRDLPIFTRQTEEYSNKTHLSAVLAAIQYSDRLFQTQYD
jgi:hypothetical protein